MHSSWYSRRRIEALGKETGSNAVAGAKDANFRRRIVDIHIGRSLRHATKLGGIRCITHIARLIECERICNQENNRTLPYS